MAWCLLWLLLRLDQSHNFILIAWNKLWLIKPFSFLLHHENKLVIGQYWVWQRNYFFAPTRWIAGSSLLLDSTLIWLGRPCCGKLLSGAELLWVKLIKLVLRTARPALLLDRHHWHRVLLHHMLQKHLLVQMACNVCLITKLLRSVRIVCC